MRISFVAALLALPMLAGCASGPIFSEAPPPENGKALVYIYREPNFAGAGEGAAFFIDEQRVVELMAGGYSFVYLAPGHYEVEQRWTIFSYASRAEQSVSTQLDVKAGDVRYVRFRTGLGGPSCYNCVSVAWKIEQVPPSVGRSEIAREKLTVPKVQSLEP